MLTPEDLEEIEALIDKKVARVIALANKVDALMTEQVHPLLARIPERIKTPELPVTNDRSAAA
jgi:hypothetical protein